MTVDAAALPLPGPGVVVVSTGLAAVVGYAIQRSSICAVAAVEEILERRGAELFLGFVEAMLWVVAVTVPLVWLTPLQPKFAAAYPLGTDVLAGGFLFGVGAVLNGGCAFSTSAQLAGGNLAMLITFAGFAAGAFAHGRLVGSSAEPVADWVSPWRGAPAWSIGLVVLIWFGLAAALWRLRRGDARRRRIGRAMAVIGASSGILYAIYGPWAWTTVLGWGVQHPLTNGPRPPFWVGLVLFAGLLAGAALGAWRAGRLGLRWSVERHGSVARLLGGALMGFGAAMVPGGNEALLLNAMPALAPHAFAAYLAIMAGSAAALLARSRWRAVQEVRRSPMPDRHGPPETLNTRR